MKKIIPILISATLVFTLSCGKKNVDKTEIIHSETITQTEKGYSFGLPSDKMREIGNKVWENESGRSTEQLLAWNTYENFASLGIGHFIWFPEGVNPPFEESFPKLVEWVENKYPELVKEEFSDWYERNSACPWQSKESLQRSKDNPGDLGNIILRNFLSETIEAQTEYIVVKAESSILEMLQYVQKNQGVSAANDLKSTLFAVAELPSKPYGTPKQGVFALVDYVNFKGNGTSEKERFNNEGWGLLQVLNEMGYVAGEEFERACIAVLERRIANNPNPESDNKHLQGWKNRIDLTYFETN